MGVFDMLGGSAQQSQGMPPPSFPEHGGMYAAWEAEDLKGIVGVTLDNSSLLISIESSLSGKVLVTKQDPKTGKKYTEWERVGKPKMNDRGVQSVVMEVRTFLDKNVIMGYYPSEEVLLTMWESWATEFAIFLAWNSEEFETVESYRSMIHMHISLAVLQTMYRALEGNEKQGVYKMIKRIENAVGETVAKQRMFGQTPKI